MNGEYIKYSNCMEFYELRQWTSSREIQNIARTEIKCNEINEFQEN